MGTDDWISTSYTPDSRMIPRKRLRQQNQGSMLDERHRKRDSVS